MLSRLAAPQIAPRLLQPARRHHVQRGDARDCSHRECRTSAPRIRRQRERAPQRPEIDHIAWNPRHHACALARGQNQDAARDLAHAVGAHDFACVAISHAERLAHLAAGDELGDTEPNAEPAQRGRDGLGAHTLHLPDCLQIPFHAALDIPGFRTTLMWLSSLSQNFWYASGASSSGSVWEITNDGSISPASMRFSSWW